MALGPSETPASAFGAAEPLSTAPTPPFPESHALPGACVPELPGLGLPAVAAELVNAVASLWLLDEDADEEVLCRSPADFADAAPAAPEEPGGP